MPNPRHRHRACAAIKCGDGGQTLRFWPALAHAATLPRKSRPRGAVLDGPFDESEAESHICADRRVGGGIRRPHRELPIIALSCAALPTLIEISELAVLCSSAELATAAVITADLPNAFFDAGRPPEIAPLVEAALSDQPGASSAPCRLRRQGLDFGSKDSEAAAALAGPGRLDRSR